MQDPALSTTVFRQLNTQPQLPEQQQVKCPRCESSNTKFCYYNNYNLSQPRYFCKSCRRYWTKDGTLHKIPVGGGSRKNTSTSEGSSSNPPAINIDASSPSGSECGNPDQTPDSAWSAWKAAVNIDTSVSGHDLTEVPAPESGASAGVGSGFSFSSIKSSGGKFGDVFDGPGHLGGGLVADLNSELGLGPNRRAEDGSPDLAISTPGSTTNRFHYN